MEDRKRRKKTGVPDSIQFQTKPEIALEQIRHARKRYLPEGVVLADAGYGTDTPIASRWAISSTDMRVLVTSRG